MRLLRVIAACESALERLDGSVNPALVAQAAGVRVTQARAQSRLAEIRTARSAAAGLCARGCDDAHRAALIWRALADDERRAVCLLSLRADVRDRDAVAPAGKVERIVSSQFASAPVTKTSSSAGKVRRASSVAWMGSSDPTVPFAGIPAASNALSVSPRCRSACRAPSRRRSSGRAGSEAPARRRTPRVGRRRHAARAPR